MSAMCRAVKNTWTVLRRGLQRYVKCDGEVRSIESRFEESDKECDHCDMLIVSKELSQTMWSRDRKTLLVMVRFRSK